MLDLADLRARLEAQLAAVAEAEQALARVHHLCGLPLPVERVDGLAGCPIPADPSERVQGSMASLGASTDVVSVRSATQQLAMRSCPGCGTQFVRETPAQRFCHPECRVRQANKRAYQRKRARADAEWQERTAQLRQLHEREGFQVSNGEAR
jgi:endogenous inhibitor of DNA gyrase (YacG/DUF329 family)